MIYVCNLEEMPRHAESLRPSHLVSLNNPDELPQTPPGVRPSRHLRIAMHDITDPVDDHIHPEVEHVEALVAFLQGWSREGPLLIHCYAGVSRSMAAALIALRLHVFDDPASAARRLRAAAPHARPNRRIIELADPLLGAGGRLVAGLADMGDALPVIQGPLVRVSPEARIEAAGTRAGHA